ncbi:hypothetical protein V7O62_02265 [Methanolobus sp. ZRKC2]|uniref:hypothetical protein n=1 Tax=Methanolobus sp. ZRKC2 TaxID=3125783 RepID=UPI00324661B3
MSDLVLLMNFWSQVVAQIFMMLDSVYFGDHSILNILCAFEFASITIWGVFALVETHKGGDSD